MKEKIRIFVVDDSKKVVNEVNKYFKSHAEIELVGIASDGNEALEVLRREHNNIDVLVMDLIIPKMDGLSVLEALHKEGIMMKSIITTSINSLEVINKCMEVGVNYYLLKPYDYETLEKRVLAMAITDLVHSLGIPSHIKGYSYIRDGIDLMYRNPNMIGAITKELYPEIASKYDTTSSRVERAIRHAIEVSWSRGDYDVMEDLFGHSVDYDRAKPTNSEFIATIADKLRLDRAV